MTYVDWYHLYRQGQVDRILVVALMILLYKYKSISIVLGCSTLTESFLSFFFLKEKVDNSVNIERSMSPSKQFDLGGYADSYHSFEGFKSIEEGLGFQDFVGPDSSSDLRVYRDNATEGELQYMLEKDKQELFLSDFGPPFQLYNEGISKVVDVESKSPEHSETEKVNGPLASLRFVNDFTSRSKKLHGEAIHHPYFDREIPEVIDTKLSTNAIIRLAGQNLIEPSSPNSDRISPFSHPFPCSFSGLTDNESKDVELLQNLLASAGKIGQQQYASASELIEQYDKMCSNEGTPAQRLVYYFSQALRERIKRETERVTYSEMGRKQIFDLKADMMSPDASKIAFYKRVPMLQVCQFTAIQTIIENVREAKKVHIVDLEIRTGMQHTVLLQALAARCEWHFELIKITAVGTRSESKLKETGKHLTEFAESMNLPLSFKVVMVENILDLHVELFELDDDEKVAVYSPFILSTLIEQSNRLEYLMRVIRKIDPCITVITEVEANHASPAFVNRFIEALFFYGAFFDCMSDCLADDELNRKVLESVSCAEVILNIVAAEGEERTIRHVGLDVWRTFFSRFGMLEIELSTASQYQANLLLEDFDCGSSCMLNVAGKGLLVGWKGVPIFSVSAWMFV